MISLEPVRKTLSKFGQEHLLRFWDKLNEEEQRTLLDDINNINVEETVKLFERINQGPETQKKLSFTLEPVPAELYGSQNHKNVIELENLKQKGLKQIADNHVGVLVLAGGQGTRLGVQYPKGQLDIGLPSGKTLFQIQAEKIVKLQTLAQKLYSQPCIIPWYIMTSPATMKDTEKFFKLNNYFGLKKENVIMFQQGVLPCFNFEGKILLESMCKIAKSPDGNGGLYKALKENKIFEDMDNRGIKYIHVYCVDNILVKVADPIFLGYCVNKGAECAAKVVEKVSPSEPIGVVCKVGEKLQVVEYSEITLENAEKRNEDNTLTFNAGNICNHFFTCEFLKCVAYNYENQMKLHRAEKKIPYINEEGKQIKPVKPNGVKIEKFVFDVFPFASNFVIWEVPRDEEFSAIKNSLDADKDNANTAKTSIYKLHKKFIEEAGGTVMGEELVEISPLLSYNGEGLEEECKSKTFMGPKVLWGPTEKQLKMPKENGFH